MMQRKANDAGHFGPDGLLRDGHSYRWFAMVASDISSNCWPIIDPAVRMTEEQTNER
jgi:hypothetical protein